MRKKIILILIISIALCVPNVIAANIEGCKEVLPNAIIDEKIPNTVHAIILLIQIAVPVLLVIFGMLDLFKGITAQKEDEIKKGQQMFIKRLISAAIIFFVVAIVKILISFVADDSGKIFNCVDCFLNGTKNCGLESDEQSYMCSYYPNSSDEGDVIPQIYITMIKGKSQFQVGLLQTHKNIEFDNWDVQIDGINTTGIKHQENGTCPAYVISFRAGENEFNIYTHYIVSDTVDVENILKEKYQENFSGAQVYSFYSDSYNPWE